MKINACLVCLLTFSYLKSWAATYSGGDGSQSNPYQIANASDLATLSATSGDWGSGIYFIQTANITVTGTWSPIGNSTTKFRGNYDGQGKTVSGISIDNTSLYYAGFFGYTDGATIQNLGVSVTISARSVSGGLIGYAQSTTITNCFSTGSISGYYGTIGGLIGTVNGCTVSNCYSTAVVSAGTSGSGTYSGGLIAKTDNAASAISNSYHTTGRVGGWDYVGGVVGALMHGSLSGCYSTGLVEGSLQTGGLVGHNSATISNCYSHAVANCANTAGGLVGNNNGGTITNSYSTGNPGATTNEGGFAGQNSGTISNCFWDKTSSESETSAGGTGKTTAEMKTLSTFTSAGWDFEAETANGTNDYWDMDYSGAINYGYPYLSWQDGDDVSLPVELTSFAAECQASLVILKWVTESETENLGFILERKMVGANHALPSSWSQIASYLTDKSLEGHGSTSEKHAYQFTDKSVQPGVTYRYRLADVDYSGKVTWHKEVEVKVAAGAVQMPVEFGLYKVYPNPFNPSVTLNYTLPNDGQVSLKVYNLRGQLIETILSTYALRSSYTLNWSPQNLSSGVYFIQLQSANRINRQKVVFVK
jgi:hypothetical protein